MSVVSRDIDIYYVEAGSRDRETVLFCHGAGGNSTSWWQQMSVFAERFHCVALDHRGFGRSRCQPDGFRVAEFGADALAVLDAVETPRAHFVCQSMGGWTGVQVALEHRDRIQSLVLSDTIGGIALPAGLDSIRSMMERAQLAGAVNPALAADYPRKNPSGAFLYQELSAFNLSHEELGLNAKLFAPEVLIDLERCADLDLPVLLFAGSDDLIWPPEVIHELGSHIPGSRVVDVDSGHSPYFENPQAFNAALSEFLP